MADQNLMDKSLRSVFVGNIPYEATEEKLKDIFSEVGPVNTFKLVYDRESGKPKGYGFCEYKDQETALSAMRNLNGFEIGGRTLRVDNACTEKSRMEMQNLMQGPPIENPYGEAVQGDKAPEAISKAVASLPPEQMFELMKQMKLCIQNNPNEARTMLLQNPQLAYALLQAQVVMRIVDPVAAAGMLHKANPSPVPLAPLEQPVAGSTPPVAATSAAAAAAPAPVPLPVPPPAQVPTISGSDSPIQPVVEVSRVDPRLSRNPDPEQHFPRDPRMAGPRVDPRTTVPRSAAAPITRPQQILTPSSMSPSASGPAASDQEKAALIMQVLQLSDEQIAMLPPEQRQSILVLKEQIAKSTQR